MPRILVTGASGFVGRHLCERLLADGHELIALSRSGTHFQGARNLEVDFEKSEKIPDLKTIDAVIHLAAHVPHANSGAQDLQKLYKTLNEDVTIALARAAAQANVGRFLFLSSTSVYGDQSPPNKRFNEEDSANPHGLYAKSKHAAEIALTELSATTGLAITIVRAPLIYGADAPGKFAKLLTLIKAGVPLPLAAVKNKRSFIYIDNLVDALALCEAHPKAANKLYLVCDGEDVSTPELIRQIAAGLGRPARLISVPLSILRLPLRMIGKTQMLDNIASSFLVDGSKIRDELGWVPPVNLREGLRHVGQITR